MKDFYRIKIAGLERDLPICKLNDKISIAAFVIFGDVELTEACAKELCAKIPEHDYIITAESKGIPLAYEMARQMGETYLLARKMVKVYMKEPIGIEVQSITTKAKQTLYLDKADADKMKGKRIVIVDDVISTGESLNALEQLVRGVGGNIVGRMTILAEGEAAHRDDIVCLGELPLFENN